MWNTVVANGLCVGCGACAADPGHGIDITLDQDGRYQPVRRNFINNPSLNAKLVQICPFSSSGPHENELLPQSDRIGCQSPELGYVLETYAGFVQEGKFRSAGSAGGMTSWLLEELLRRNLVDAVIHVQESSTGKAPLFLYTISRSGEQVRRGAKSRYYPIEMSRVLREVGEQPGRYALVGVPCFIKAALRLARVDPIIAGRLTFSVALFCGHLKSTAFAASYALSSGIPPDQLVSIDFRVKNPQRSSANYSVSVTGRINGEVGTITRSNRDFYCSNWGVGFFKLKACDYCDDVVGETADVSFGDAWLPEYEDYRGTNVVVVRNKVINDVLLEGAEANRIELERIDPERVIKSQAGGFRHRREGLAYRLYLADKAGLWRPRKRVSPSRTHLTGKRRRLYALRAEIAAKSHIAMRQALEQANFDTFKQQMDPLVKKYFSLVRLTRQERALRKFKHLWGKLRGLLWR